ncbi:MAG: N-formylglutamate amidohydrolase [Alphaproteobacteria bacterium]|nr:N-formylglutamate amidohydrolase [Alphaproteobacteria bacterium]
MTGLAQAGGSPGERRVDVPIEVRAPSAQTTPYVFASPHSGRAYSADFLSATQLDPLTLRRSEDCYVDELFAGAPARGAPLLLAHFPRAYCDVNRDPAELDPAIIREPIPQSLHTRSPRVSAGLGVIARIVRDGAEIYSAPMPLAEAGRRLESLHAPYHATLRTLVDRTTALFGCCALIDCHSMPSQAAASVPGLRGRMVDIVLGDRFGASCHPALTDHAERCLAALGFSVARNNPYAGGYTAESYGAPGVGVHALQIEINRALYLDEDRLEKRPACFAALCQRLNQFIDALMRFTPTAPQR